MIKIGGLGVNGFHDKSADELLSFLASNPDFDNSQFVYNNNNEDMLNNFQNFGGPNLSSVMFDGYTTATDDSNLHQTSNNNNNY